MINKQGLLFKFYAPITKMGSEIVKGQEKFFLEGYAATSDLDRDDEIITLSALKQGAEDLLINHAVFYEHKSDEHPVGKVVRTDVIEAKDDESDKLYVKVYISETAKTIRTLIKEGILDKFSICGKVLKAETEFNEEVRKDVLNIYSMELYEVSVVGLPANIKAEAIGYEIHKSFNESKVNKVVNGLPLCKTKEDTEVDKIIKSEKKEEKVAEKKEVEKKEEPKVEKIEKKEVKIEKTETPKEEIKKETSVEKKVETSKEEAKKEAPVEKIEEPKKKEEVKKSEETLKDDKTVVEKPVEKKEEVIEKQEEEEEPKTVKCPACGKMVIPVDGKCPECGADIPEELVEYYDIEDILESLKVLQKDVSELLSIAKAGKKEEKPKETPKEDIEAAAEKAIEKKLGNVRVVPTRKGLIIRDNKEEKLKEKSDNKSPLEVLSDRESYEKLDEKTKKNTIRRGLLQILKNSSILNDTDDDE